MFFIVFPVPPPPKKKLRQVGPLILPRIFFPVVLHGRDGLCMCMYVCGAPDLWNTPRVRLAQVSMKYDYACAISDSAQIECW
jgi:hypothetical protein